MAYDDIVLKGYVYDDSGDGIAGATVKVYAGDSADTATSGSALADTTTGSTTTAGMWTITSSNSATDASNRLDVEITSSGGTSKRRIKYRDSIQVENIDAEKIIVRAVEAGDAAVHFFADGADDAGDYWRINAGGGAGNSHTFAIGSDKASAGTIIDYITITNGGDAASSLTAIGGSLVIGHTEKETISIDGATDLAPGFQILGTAAADASMMLAAFSTTATIAGSPILGFVKGGNATIGSHTVVTDDEELGNIVAYGDDGTDLEAIAAQIQFEVDGTPGTGDMPGRIVFATTADGAEVATEAMRIDSSQDVSLLTDSVVLGFGADKDTTLTHTDGTGLTLNSTNKLTFGDTGTFIHQSSNGVLTIESDTTVDINGAVVFNGALSGITNITLSGTLSDGNYTFDTSGNVSGLGTVGSGAITSTGLVTGVGVTSTGDFTTTGQATDWDLIDNNASALSFDASGKTGILEIVTSDSSEQVKMSGGLNVTGTATLATVDINAGAIDGTTIGANSAAAGTFAAIVGTTGTFTGAVNVADDQLFSVGTGNDTVVLNRSTSLSADVEISNVIEGTSDHPGVAANSLLVSNITNDGDMMFLVSDGGNSKGLLKLVGSTGYMNIFPDMQGRLGIGTASPQVEVHLNDPGGGTIKFQMTNSTTGEASGNGLLISQVGLNTTIDNQEDGTMSLSTAGTARVTIGATGDLDLNDNDLLNAGAGDNEWTANQVKLQSSYDGTNEIRVFNSRNSDADDNARFYAMAGAANGDPLIGFETYGVTAWSVGIDNSDSDKFKIAPSSALATNTAISITTAGAVTIPGVVTFEEDFYLGDGDRIRMGAGQDLQIYHESNESVITHNGSGVLTIDSANADLILKAASGERIDFYIASGRSAYISAENWYFENNNIYDVGAAGNEWTATQLSVNSASDGGYCTLYVNNSSTSANSKARVVIQAPATSGASDPYIYFAVTSGVDLTYGLDNSDSDNLVWSDDDNLGTNNRMKLVPSTGVLSVDGEDTGATAAQVNIFDDYDDAIELDRYAHATLDLPDITPEQRIANREHLVQMGIAEWAKQAEGPDHIMLKIQPLSKLLAGGVYQNRYRMDRQYDEIDKRLAKIEQALGV